MNKDLAITYIINFSYMLLRALTYALSCFLVWRAFDWMDRVDIRKEITENRNIGWAAIISSIMIGLAYVIGQM